MMTTSRRRPRALDAWRVALFMILLAAVALRLYGLNWDEGADLHPDELFIAKIVLIDRIHLAWPPDLNELRDPARSGLNPRSADPATGQFREFAYGALPLFVTDFVAWIVSRLTGTNWNAMDHAYLVGRAISALLGALTILPIAALGIAIGGRKVGLLAALFAALAPMSIQLSHFFTTDSWLGFFVALTLVASVWAAESASSRRFALAGAAFGLAMATKGSVFTLAVPVAVAIGIGAFGSASGKPGSLQVRDFARWSVAAMGGAAVAFFAFEPYALMRPDVYLQSLRTQAEIVSGSFDVPFTRVYAGTTPLLYQLDQFVRWGYGPVAGLLALFGIGLLALAAKRKASPGAIVLTSWTIAYSAVLLVSDAKFLRYLEPLAPVMAVGAALGLVWLVTAVGTRWAAGHFVTAPAILLLVLAWTGAFLSIYAHENPRVSATKWIYGDVPPGSRVTAEYWDDPLPRALSYALSPVQFGFETIQIDLYRDLPPVQESASIFNVIKQADFIVQSSERVEAAMWAAPWRYPVQERYFDQLEHGLLGFQTAASFARQPTIAGIAFDDQRADESFINYDHPRVTIYGHENKVARSLFDQAMDWALQRPWAASRHAPQSSLLLDRPVGENPSVDDARWSATVTNATPIALAVWVVFLLALVVIGIPLARLAFAGFPDAGWGLARTLAMMVCGYLVWIGASLRLIRFQAIWVFASLIGVGLLGWWLIRRRSSLPRSLRDFSRSRTWVHAEVAFWLVFFLFLAFRLIDPDGWHPLWGGEKPMEFAQINAIGRSAFFPPYDPWYADGYINYYYYGFYLVAFLLKATGIPSEIGFNLTQPTIIAMLASGVFTLGTAICGKLTRSPRLAIAGGWLTVVTVSLMGNLSALRSLLSPVPLIFDSFIYWTWNGSRAIDNVITEFPYFTGLYADLHAHVVALPLTVVVIALCFALAAYAPSSGQLPVNQPQRNEAVHFVGRLFLIALALGTLFATNAWDVPVYAILSVSAILMASSVVRPWPLRAVAFVTASLAVVAASWLLFLPFHQHFVALFNQVALVREPTNFLQFLTHFGALIAICAVGLTVLLLPSSRASHYGIIWPIFSLVGGMFGLAIAAAGISASTGPAIVCLAIAAPPLVTAWPCKKSIESSGRWSVWIARGLTVTAAFAATASVLRGWTVLGLLLALGGAAAAGWLVLLRPAERFLCLLLAGGFLTAAGAEVVVVADDLIGTTAYRMNTVFKFYNQVWVLLGLSAAGLMILMFREAMVHRSRRPKANLTLEGRAAWAITGAALGMLLIATSLAYPIVATGPRLAQKFSPGAPFGTLNALDWMKVGTVPVLANPEADELGFRGDAAAIDWLQQNIKGTPVIAEASIGPYRCNGSRISNATGLPTIIGWERHEQQQRYPETLPDRVRDVRTLYTSVDPHEKAAILYRYNVEYVIVGELERLYPTPDNDCTPTGSDAGIAAFNKMIGTTLAVAHSEDGTTIYRVLPLGGD
jgi:YYY domain-containing protein